MEKWIGIKTKIIDCLQLLYRQDAELFTRNNGRGISERCLNFRFAYYLQMAFQDNNFIDCDFNSYKRYGVAHDAKMIPDQTGEEIGRFVDIIVHKRDGIPENNLVCFEMKKWNNEDLEGIAKDKINLAYLTLPSGLGYLYGFHITYGRSLENTTFQIYSKGKSKPEQGWRCFNNE